MRTWRQLSVLTIACAVLLLSLPLVLQFLAPTLSYELRDRVAERLSGRRDRKVRIALGTASGSYYHIGTVLNRYLREKSGYELELVVTAGVPENVGAVLDRSRGIDLATIESSSEEAARADGLTGLAVIGQQYFFVVVPNESPVREFRDLRGAVNPGVRGEGQAPTLGERVLSYYGLLAPPRGQTGAAPVSVVRPRLRGGVLQDFKAGHMDAATRTQTLQSDFLTELFDDGGYRLVPVKDHEALARALPGTAPAFIPAGVFGPGRRTPPEPVASLSVASLLVAHRDLPGRVARDILDVVYDRRFARDILYPVSEESGRNVGDLPLHPAAHAYYHRNDVVTSDRIGRLTFVLWAIGAAVATAQFIARVRQHDRKEKRRQLLASELDKLDAIRRHIESPDDVATARRLMAEADGLLANAERDAAAGLLDAEGIQSLRSLHELCWRSCRRWASGPQPSETGV
jgi:TRAP-type uncharacterized transport system substrate-binding protein